MDKLCIIAARSGSKRLPLKNRKKLLGRPLYYYTLRAAVDASLFKYIIFTTDDEEIIKGLNSLPNIDRLNLIIDKRPFFLADDKTIIWDVVEYILLKYKKLIQHIKYLCILTPCHPFRKSIHIKEAFNYILNDNIKAVISVSEFPCPPEICMRIKKGKVYKSWSGAVRKANYEKAYYPNGAITIIEKNFFLKEKNIYNENLNLNIYKMQFPYDLDIDEKKDFYIAEILADKFL